MPIQTLTAEQAHTLISNRKAVLVDIREADEFARAHVSGALSAPASATPALPMTLPGGRQPVFMCRSGARTALHCERLAADLGVPAMMLAGGLDAWRQAGLPVATDSKAPLEMMRQVQIAAGLFVMAGLGLGWTVHPAFFAVSTFVGAGLTFAGVTGFCGLARVLGVMPWNRRAAS